jgi:lambda repressor-like predicted transcriptional regulator
MYGSLFAPRSRPIGGSLSNRYRFALQSRFGSLYVRSMEANGASIRAIRRKNGQGLRSLAADTGLSRSYLSEIENGHKPGTERTLKIIAAALDVPLPAICNKAPQLVASAK